DKSWTNGHFFSVKAPGLPAALLPAYAGLEAVGAPALSRELAENARESGARQWTYRGLNVSAYGYDPERATRVKRQLENQAPLIWALGLLGSVLPAIGLLLVVRMLAERLRPGTGTLTALSLGTATLVMVFAVQLFGHVAATLLAFGAFALLWREREGERERGGLVALAGVLSGLAVVTEYPLALAGAICGLYALSRPSVLARGARGVVGRGGLYAAGVVAGVLPLLAYNLWAFGSLGTMSYDNAVDRQGFTGHDTLGLNSGGFFGITWPDGRVALELLVSPRGLVALTPIVALAAYGVWLMHRRGRRAEAWTIAAITLAFFVYDTGYWLPFGGGSPGPRFLIPVLPFLILGLAETWRRLPATTLALSAVGATVMLFATLTYPLIGTGSIWQWWARVENGEFQHTLLTVLGLGNGPGPVFPVVAGVLGEVKIVGVGATAKGAVDTTGLPWQIAVIALVVALLALGGARWARLRAQRREARSAAQVVDDERAATLAAHA
ncbi:MAG: hypothetical protein MUC84_08495, partial [Solirubrobacteraceae bacterium]|nr:hypothetical protein [Solirubrobacteraceae bacterium]